MNKIQAACDELDAHQDIFVRTSSSTIRSADLARDAQWQANLAALEKALSASDAAIRVLKIENKRLKTQLKISQASTFGPSSEKTREDDVPAADLNESDQDILDEQAPSDMSGQPPENGEDEKDTPRSGDVFSWLDEEEQAEDQEDGTVPAAVVEEERAKGRAPKKLPEHLPRESNRHLPEQGTSCCGRDMHELRGETYQQLDWIPGHLLVREDKYPRFYCSKCRRFHQAKVPKKIRGRSYWGDDLTNAIIIAKYADFLPLYRQEEMFRRLGIDIHRSTMARQIAKAVKAFMPIYLELLKYAKEGKKLHMDETRMPMLHPGLGKTKSCYGWAICRDGRRCGDEGHPAVFFHFSLSRKGKVAEKLLEGFSGFLQVDGYKGYNRLSSDERPDGPITLATCWAHVRRKFRATSEATKSNWAYRAYSAINLLYRIEARIEKAGSAKRLEGRRKWSRPVVAKIFKTLKYIHSKISRKSRLASDIRYALEMQDSLSVFLRSGLVEMDNNPVENTIRPIALLRKNCMFAGSEGGGENWAVLASLIGTCRLNKIDPLEYFNWLSVELVRKGPKLSPKDMLPWKMPRKRPEA